MGLFDHFPYTNIHEMNLDWIMQMMKALEAAWGEFVAGNSLTFADPLLHDLTSTYAENTIVLDKNGNAYVSLKAVPVGVNLSNTEYWLMVFDYETFLEKVNKNFTDRYYRNEPRAKAAMSVGDWLTFDDVLCKVIAAIAEDDLLEVGVNIEHFTLEDFIKAFMQSATQMIQQYKNDIDASELAYRQQLANDIANTTASLQAQLDAAISGATVDSEVINARVGADGVTYPTLGDAIRTQITDTNTRIDETNAGINGTNGILDYLTERPYIITSTGIWQNAQAAHIAVPVNAADLVDITANSSQSAVYAALKTDNSTGSGVSVDFCADTLTERWTERKVLAVNNTASFAAPSDCTLIYVAVHPVNPAQNLLPVSIKINGVELCYNIRKRIDELTEFSIEVDNVLPDLCGDVSRLNELSNRAFDIWGLRRALDGFYDLVTLPAYSHLSGMDLSLFTDGYSFKHTIDLRKYKNASNNEYHVSTNAQLASAISNAAAGDTIYIADGVYTGISFSKSLNLIGNKHTIFASGYTGAFEDTATPGVYKTTPDFTFVDGMILLDATLMDKGIIIPLVKVANTTQVINTKGSFVVSGNKLYVHPYNDAVAATDTNIIVTDDNSNAGMIRLTGSSADAVLYLENINVFGGASCLYGYASATYPDQSIIAYNCHFGFSFTNDNVMLRGVKGYFQNCISEHSALDGFNYHYNNSTDGILSYGLEVDCIAHDNGIEDTSPNPSNNGSTMHDGGKIVRINGVYYNNNGGNVADTSPSTESYNYGCVAFDSIAPYDDSDQTSADFWSRYASVYLYGCRGIGDSQYNLRTDSYGQINVNKTEYTTYIGNINTI